MRVLLFCLLYFCFFSFSVEAADQADYIAPNSKVDFDFNSRDSFQKQGLFEVAGDVDVYRVSVPYAAYLDIETLGEADPYLRVFDASEKILAFDDNNGTKLNSRLVYQVAAGTYFIVLDNRAEVDTFYDLKVSLRSIASLNDDVANNLNPGLTLTLDPNISSELNFTKAINYSGDSDAFNFDLKSSGSISFLLEANLYPLRFILYDKDYRIIREAELSSNERYIHNLAAGRYIIVLQGKTTASSNYNLKITHSNSILDEDSASIDSFRGREIKHLRLSQQNTNKKSLKGSIDFIGDVDTIKITVDEAADMVLMVRLSKKREKTPLTIRGRLFDFQGREIASDLAALNFRIDKRLTAGTYYLSIFSDPDNDKTGKYKIISLLIYERD